MPAVKMLLLLKAGLISTLCDSSNTRNGASEKALCKNFPSYAQVRMLNTCGAGNHDC